MTELIKYSKTMHLPFSLGLQNDDRRLPDDYCFDGKTIAVTVKMDGENTSMYRDAIHARSLYGMSHYSQHYIKAYHATIKHLIPEGWRICGENMYARHSIPYDNLDSFFYVFNIWNDDNHCLPLDRTLELCEKWGLKHVPAKWLHTVEGNDFKSIEKVYLDYVAQGEEGIVIRNVARFKYEDFQSNVAKAVRKNHVQTDVHWTKTWVPNKLKNGN